MNRTCVIIPAYNENKGISSVVKKIRLLGLDAVVIDDGSIDSTADIAQNEGAIVLRNLKNLGKGAALRRGFDYVLKAGYDVVITMDGDGQHNPETVAQFLELENRVDADIIVGNRMRNTENMPLLRIATNRFMSWLISWKTGQHIPDTQCGFRLIRASLLKNITLLSSRYDMESEILIIAAKKGHKIESLPIETIYHGSKSQIHPVLDTMRFIRTYFRLLWKK